MPRYTPIALISLAGLLMLMACPRAEEIPGPGLRVTATLRPTIMVALSEEAITFKADHGPGTYDANTAVAVQVGTNCTTWALTCIATDLTAPQGTLPAARVFVSHRGTTMQPDAGAGATFVSLGLEHRFAEGGAMEPGVVNTLKFRLLTKLDDEPGSYTGTVQFRALATP